MPLDKPFDDITLEDIQSLIDNEVVEQKTIEYKQQLSISNRDEKKEFLADVSSFANASGGHLVFGIQEKKGVPIDIVGIELVDTDATISQIESIVRDCVKPRIAGFHVRCIPHDDKKYVIIIRIPRSWVPPHVVQYSGSWRFYSRNSNGKYPLDIQEVRSEFLQSGLQRKEMERFRFERYSLIEGFEPPVQMDPSCFIVFHTIPISTFKGSIPIDISTFRLPGTLNMLSSHFRGVEHRFNFDGYLLYTPKQGTSKGRYLQLFRNGVVEGVSASGELFIENRVYVNKIEYEIIETIKSLYKYYKNFSIEPPIYFSLYLKGIKDFLIHSGQRYTDCFIEDGIDRNELLLPEIIIDEFNETSISQILKPVFDTLWNAFGYEHSPNYDQNGNWINKGR